jgi:hypothetical protein
MPFREHSAANIFVYLQSPLCWFNDEHKLNTLFCLIRNSEHHMHFGNLNFLLQFEGWSVSQRLMGWALLFSKLRIILLLSHNHTIIVATNQVPVPLVRARYLPPHKTTMVVSADLQYNFPFVFVNYNLYVNLQFFYNKFYYCYQLYLQMEWMIEFFCIWYLLQLNIFLYHQFKICLCAQSHFLSMYL